MVKRKSFIIANIIFLLIVALLGISLVEPKTKRYEKLVMQIKEINTVCNSVYEDLEGSKIKYEQLLKTEQDIFKKGIYNSALVQIHLVNNDYNKVLEYSKNAIINYSKMRDGSFMAIQELKHLAWNMLKFEKYSESFLAANEVMFLLQGDIKNILHEKDIVQTEALVYSIFLYMYTDFDMFDKAEIFYDKLIKLENNEFIEDDEKAAYTKMIYSIKKDDANLIKKYATKCYEIYTERDKIHGTKLADSVIINVAYGDLKLGNYDEAIRKIQKAEEFYKKLDDDYGIATVYNIMGEYYTEIKDFSKAETYYEQAIDICNKLGFNKQTINMLESYIEFLKERDPTSLKTNKYYEEYFNLLDNKKNDNIGIFLEDIINTNDVLNQIRMDNLEDKTRASTKMVIIACVTIMFLLGLIVILILLIRKQKATEKKLETFANTDYLTGAKSRAYGEKIIIDKIKRGDKFSLAIIDIDNFKKINDSYGHLFGDEILRVISEYLINNLSKDDTIIRFGGEEFLLIFANKEKKASLSIINKLKSGIYNIDFDNSVNITFSGGIVEVKSGDINEIIKEADTLLYEAKNTGKNKIL